MLETILKLYVMAMATGVTSPLPHLIGPPGCGKSTVAEQLAEVVGKKLHVINVARLSPLDVEGVQMPHGDGEDMALKMLPATFWTSLNEGDIVLLDEFLRGFPEVYNALLDILTGRRAGAFVLPRVFILGASNSNVSYDKALEDRLLHIPVPDPRSDAKEKKRLGKLIVDRLGLLPEMANSMEMQSLLDSEVLPMFDILDSFKGIGSAAPSVLKGSSIRNLIGQAELRYVQSSYLIELLKMNNNKAMRAGKPQYVFLVKAQDTQALSNYEDRAQRIAGDKSLLAKLTDTQRRNLSLNLQLIEMEKARHEKGTNENDDADSTFIDDLLS